MGKPKKIDHAAQYLIELSGKEKVGGVWLKPSQERIVVKGKVLDQISADKVVSATLIDG